MYFTFIYFLFLFFNTIFLEIKMSLYFRCQINIAPLSSCFELLAVQFWTSNIFYLLKSSAPLQKPTDQHSRYQHFSIINIIILHVLVLWTTWDFRRKPTIFTGCPNEPFLVIFYTNGKKIAVWAIFSGLREK